MVTCSYVGSTTNFNKRKGQHKSACQNEKLKEYHFKVYQTMRDNGGWDNWDMIPLEEFACENKIQQVIREQYWIDKLNPEMNCKVAYQPLERIEYMKVYYEANIDKIKEYKNIYAEANKEHIKEYSNTWREANKEHIKEKKSIKITCKCGSVCRFNDKARHERSKKHLDFKT